MKPLVFPAKIGRAVFSFPFGSGKVRATCCATWRRCSALKVRGTDAEVVIGTDDGVFDTSDLVRVFSDGLNNLEAAATFDSGD